MSRREKLLRRMRQSSGGWGPEDLAALYLGFGFIQREGGNHTVYSHPKYPDLRATVARHQVLANGYVQHAVKLIDTLKEREALEDEHEMEADDGSQESDNQ